MAKKRPSNKNERRLSKDVDKILSKAILAALNEVEEYEEEEGECPDGFFTVEDYLAEAIIDVAQGLNIHLDNPYG